MRVHGFARKKIYLEVQKKTRFFWGWLELCHKYENKSAGAKLSCDSRTYKWWSRHVGGDDYDICRPYKITERDVSKDHNDDKHQILTGGDFSVGLFVAAGLFLFGLAGCSPKVFSLTPLDFLDSARWPRKIWCFFYSQMTLPVGQALSFCSSY